MPGPYAQGTNESLILGFETAFKTMPASPIVGDKVPVTNPSIRPERNKFNSNALIGSPEPRPITFGKISVAGQFGLECNPSSLLPILLGHFGGHRTSGLTLYAQEYYLSTMLPMFIQQSHADIAQHILWNGCYLGTLNMKFESEGLMDATVNVTGAKQTRRTTSVVDGTVTDRTGLDPFSYLLVVIKQGGTIIGYSQMCEITIDRKIGKAMAQDQTNELAVVISEIADIQGKMTALFSNGDLMDLALSGAETSLEIWLPAPNGYGLLIELPTIRFQPPAVITNGTGLVTQDLSFDAYGKSGFSQHPARVRSAYWQTSTLPSLDTLTLIVAVDGGGDQTFTLTAAESSIDALVTKINATAAGFTASVDRQAGDTGGVLRLQSNTKGTTSNITVKAASTADVLLGIDNAVHTGLDGKSILVTVLTPAAA